MVSQLSSSYFPFTSINFGVTTFGRFSHFSLTSFSSSSNDFQDGLDGFQVLPTRAFILQKMSPLAVEAVL
jgi:hypothetical protein